MTKKTVKPAQSKKYFHEVIEEEQKILDIGLKMSRRHKKELDEVVSRKYTYDWEWLRKEIKEH